MVPLSFRGKHTILAAEGWVRLEGLIPARGRIRQGIQGDFEVGEKSDGKARWRREGHA